MLGSFRGRVRQGLRGGGGSKNQRGGFETASRKFAGARLQRAQAGRSRGPGENVGCRSQKPPRRPWLDSRQLQGRRKQARPAGEPGRRRRTRPGRGRAGPVTSCTPPSCCCAMASSMPSNRSSSCSPPIAPAPRYGPRCPRSGLVSSAPPSRAASAPARASGPTAPPGHFPQRSRKHARAGPAPSPSRPAFSRHQTSERKAPSALSQPLVGV